MRRHVALVVGLGTLVAVTAVGIATAAEGEAPVTVPLPATELSMDAGFNPKALPKGEQTPISLTEAGKVSERFYGHPPPLRELTMEFDKAIEFHTAGIPSCRQGHLGGTTDTASALKACRPALIGEGEATVQVDYAETMAINIPSTLLVFKGGERDGRTTLFLHAYFSNPISAAVVIPVTIAKHPNRRFGTRAIARVPQLAGGAGSLTEFDFRFFKAVEVEGRYLNPISATCPDGQLRIFNVGKFEDGEKAESEVFRACTSRG
jgi:hypothetical protein